MLPLVIFFIVGSSFYALIWYTSKISWQLNLSSPLMELRVTLKSTNTVTINLAELKIIAAAAAYLYLSGFFSILIDGWMC